MRVDYIPNGPERAKKRWFTSDHSHWLYWDRRSQPISSQRVQAGSKARGVINALSVRGISTSLSAQGRVWSDEDFKTAYKAILEDIQSVRRGGLLVRDVETLEESLWADIAAAPPWASWRAMKSDVTAGCRGRHLRNSRRSYLGVVNQWVDSAYVIEALKVHLPKKGFEVEIKSGIIGVFAPYSEENIWLDIEAAWRYALSIAGETCTRTSM